ARSGARGASRAGSGPRAAAPRAFCHEGFAHEASRMSLVSWFGAVALLLGVLIFVHELGHFVFAKVFDVKVLRFSLGFGPRLIGFPRGHTDYRLSRVPLGGSVRLLGEDPGEAISAIAPPRALPAKPLWQRYTIVIAGPVFNLILPLFI